MAREFIVFGSPKIQEREIEEVVATLRSGWLGTGPRVKAFEAAFATYKGTSANHVAAVNSCTAALHISLISSGVGAGDEVITTPLTFCSTINAILHAGATPVLADIDPATMNMDPAEVEKKITSKTRALLPVHFAGRPCAMDDLMGIANRHGLKVIEDCAHAIESEYNGRPTGTFGDFGCFSFYVTKNVVTGEGGMVVTRRETDAARVRILALHGLSKDAWHRFGDSGYKHYQVVECGFKYNMMDLQAAIGIHQLASIEQNWQRRQELWERYQLAFTDLPVSTPAEPEAGTRHAYHLYTILIDPARAGITRDAFLDAMTARRIGVGVHYMSIPEHPYYRQRFAWNPEKWPNAMRVGRQTVSLPLSPKVGPEDAAYIVDSVSDIVLRHGR